MERITVNMSPTAMLETCHASQFDVGVQKRFDLVDGSSAYTLTGAETITLKIRTPDGTLVESNVPNTSDNYVIWTSEEGELDAFGICLCSIHVTNGSDELGSGNFIMEVEADPYNGKNIRIVTVGPADICSFETTLPEPYQSVTVNVVATGGNGTPDNPNPIVGYSSANITRCGVNLLPPYTFSDGGGIIISSNNGTYIISGTTTAYYQIIADTSFILKAGTYTLKNNGNVDNNLVVQLRSTDGLTTYASSSINSDTFTLNADTEVKFRITFNNVGSYSETISPQLELGSSPSTYTPYNGQTYVIAFGQTVYGGVLDVTRGKLHVTHACIEDLGDLYWNYVGSAGHERFSTRLDGAKRPPTNADLANIKCTCFVTSPADSTWAHTTDNIIALGATDYWIYVYTSSYTDTTAFANSVNGQKMTYELATPFDIDLTPVQIEALLGENNVFADCGQTTVEYMAEE